MKYITLICFQLFASIFAAKGDSPNIIYILADDMGYDSVSALNSSIGPLKTPYIDQIAKEGMIFTDAHSGSAVCTPTRYGILTGRYCWRTELKRSVLWEWGQPLIKKNRYTVAELLRDKGYQTGIVGKWHLGMTWHDDSGEIANSEIQLQDSYFKGGEGAERVKQTEERINFSKSITNGPIQHGFDYYFGVAVPNFPPYSWIENNRLLANPIEKKPEEMFGHPGPMSPGWKLEEILPTLGEKASTYIQESAKNKKPFFLYLPLTSPHSPISPSADYQGKSGISAYADFTIETDAVVGEVLRAVDASGEKENTIVIFTADNGTASKFADFPLLKEHGVNLEKNLRASKGSIYEGGHRVPFLVRWPAKVKAGSICNDIVCLNDFMATTAAITGANLPIESAEDSTNILPYCYRKHLLYQLDLG